MVWLNAHGGDDIVPLCNRDGFSVGCGFDPDRDDPDDARRFRSIQNGRQILGEAVVEEVGVGVNERWGHGSSRNAHDPRNDPRAECANSILL